MGLQAPCVVSMEWRPSGGGEARPCALTHVPHTRSTADATPSQSGAQGALRISGQVVAILEPTPKREQLVGIVQVG